MTDQERAEKGVYTWINPLNQKPATPWPFFYALVSKILGTADRGGGEFHYEPISAYKQVPIFCLMCYFLPMRQILFYFSGAGKFCLAHELRQLRRDVKHIFKTLNFRSDVTFAPTPETPNDIRKRSLCDVKCQNERTDG